MTMTFQSGWLFYEPHKICKQVVPLTLTAFAIIAFIYRTRYMRPGSSKRFRRRAIFKNGDCNVLQSKLNSRRLRFLQDIFTTLVDSQWRWTLLAFALSFFLSWLAFAVIWWLIAFTHGDLEDAHMPDKQGE